MTVSSSSVSVTGVTLNKATSTITVGNTEQLTATIVPGSATNQNVTWSSSDDTKATVSSSGLVTGVAAGTSTITVTTVDGNFTANCIVTVVTVINITGTWIDADTFKPCNMILSQTGTSTTLLFDSPDCFLRMGTTTASVVGNQFYLSVATATDSFYSTSTISGNTMTGLYDMAGATGTMVFSRSSATTTIPSITVPVASITVNGITSDWASVPTLITDTTGSGDCSTTTPGFDIESIKIAVDSVSPTTMYVLMKMATSTLSASSSPSFYFLDPSDNTYQRTIYLNNNGGIWRVYAMDSNDNAITDITSTSTAVVVTGQYAEFSFNLSAQLNLPSTFFLNVRNMDQVTYDSVDNAVYFGKIFLP